MTKRRIVRAAGVAVVAAALAVTIAANCFTVFHIFRGLTRVPWADEWPILEQFIRYQHGAPLWPLLWSPHWGHRFVILRLVYFANLQWGPHAPLIWLTLTLQVILIVQLCLLSWIVIARESRLLFLACVAVIANLMLSPLQMENFVWSMQFSFPLVYAAACASFLCLAISRERARSVFIPLAIGGAMVASFSMANGILVWPALVAQAAYLRLPRRVTIAIAVLGTAIVSVYCWRYTLPPIGMGTSGILRNPLDAILLMGLLLGGALDPVSLPLGIGASLLAIAAAGYLSWKALRERPTPNAPLSALAALLVFLLASAASTVAGRMSPAWLSANTPVPSRCFTLVQLFWAVLAIPILHALSRKSGPRLLIVPYCVLYLSLMFLNPQRQKSAAEDWPDFLRGVDAVGAALIAGVPDEQYLSILWPVDAEREPITAFLRERGLSIFAEPRAAWLGRRISDLFPQAPVDRCAGGIERSLAIQTAPAETSWRVEGWAWDLSATHAFDDLLIADPGGIIVGIARGGFRHGYFPGFLTEDQSVLPGHARFKASEWLGYVRQPAKTTWTVYGLQLHSNGICVIHDAPQ